MRLAIIGGSGVGEALRDGFGSAGSAAPREHDLQTPFGPPSGAILTAEFCGTPIALLQRHGPGHLFSPAAVPYRANIFALKQLGCTHIVATGAVGSLREEIRPGDVVVCDQLIDRTAGRPRTFFEHAAVHVEFAEPCCPVMRLWLLTASTGVAGLTIHPRGCYLCIEGPSFSTGAESRMHRQWGGDVVGMTALPEARLAREAEMAYALLALPTDYDCWRPRQSAAGTGGGGDAGLSLLEEIIGNVRRATQASIDLLRAALADVSMLRATPSPAHDALRLAIWSDRSRLDPVEVRRLAPLWGRHLEHGAPTGHEAERP